MARLSHISKLRTSGKPKGKRKKVPSPLAKGAKKKAREAIALTVARMTFSGHTDEAIAEALSLPPRAIATLREAPDVAPIIESVEQELRSSMAFDLTAALAAEAQPTFERMRELRDQREDLKVSFGATREFLDRLAPKVSRSEGTLAHTIRLDLATLRASAACDDEVRLIDALPVRPTLGTPLSGSEIPSLEKTKES